MASRTTGRISSIEGSGVDLLSDIEITCACLGERGHIEREDHAAQLGGAAIP